MTKTSIASGRAQRRRSTKPRRATRHGLVAAAMACGLAALHSAARAAVYQWSATVDDVTSGETKAHPRAFLWIPEGCKRVRAVVVAEQNMEEEQIFNDPTFRRTLADLGFAEVWIAPGLGKTGDFHFESGDGEVLDHVLRSLADRSGYQELTTVPLVPAGHSATAGWGWGVAAWQPKRVLCVLSISGIWPYALSAYRDGHDFDDVPGLVTKGEFEVQGSLEKGWYAGLKGDFLKKHPAMPFTNVVEPGDGHFAASPGKIALIDLYLRKAVQYRLPADTPAGSAPVLTPIDATKTGWRYEVWHLNQPPSTPAAPVADFHGTMDAYWAFDQETARAIETFQSTNRGLANVLLGYRQANGLTPPTPDHAMVHLKFEPIGDGLTFKLTGGFWDAVPATKDGKSEWANWLGEGRPVAQGSPIAHPQADAQIKIGLIEGPAAQLAPDTFAIRENRVGMDNPKRSNDVWFIATYPGDDRFQQAELRFPLANKRGRPQTIDFPAIADQKAAAARPPVQLKATSSAGLKVYYYVREGPAEVDDDGTLTFTPVPPRGRYPIPVTVVAWQWGRSIEPLVQSAASVERTFQITAP